MRVTGGARGYPDVLGSNVSATSRGPTSPLSSSSALQPASTARIRKMVFSFPSSPPLLHLSPPLPMPISSNQANLSLRRAAAARSRTTPPPPRPLLLLHDPCSTPPSYYCCYSGKLSALMLGVCNVLLVTQSTYGHPQAAGTRSPRTGKPIRPSCTP